MTCGGQNDFHLNTTTVTKAVFSTGYMPSSSDSDAPIITITVPEGQRYDWLEFSYDCRYIAAMGPSGSIIAWNADTGVFVWQYQTGRTNGTHKILFSAIDYVLTAYISGIIYVLDGASGTVIGSFNSGYLLACAPNSHLILTSESGLKFYGSYIHSDFDSGCDCIAVRQFDICNGDTIEKPYYSDLVDGRSRHAHSACFNCGGDQILATYSKFSTVTIWDTHSRRIISIIELPVAAQNIVCRFSSDESRIVCNICDEHRLMSVNVSKGSIKTVIECGHLTHIRTFFGRLGNLFIVAPFGNSRYSTGDISAYVYNCTKGNMIRAVEDPGREIVSVRFSGPGSVLI
jgi:WD40 repeat protein